MDISREYVDSLSLFYSHVTSHVITGDGKFLLAAVKAGYLAVFPIRSHLKDLFLASDTTPGEQPLSATAVYPGAKRLKPLSLNPISRPLSLLVDSQPDSSQYRLIAGGEGTIVGYTLEQVNQLNTNWTINLPSDTTLANVIALSGERIFSGCSDNNVYIHDKETQKETARFTGHQDYLHAIRVAGDRLFSAGEDGSVRCWDVRAPGDKPISVILPFKNAALERKHFGKWVGSLDISPNGEWLVCGGGPRLSVWHLTSGKCVHICDSPNVAHVAQYVPSDPSSIIFAGNGNLVTTWKLGGTAEASSSFSCQLDSSIDNIFSIAYHNYADLDYNLSSFSGDSFKIELCKNGKYIDSELFIS